MIPVAFDYQNATTVDEAISALSGGGKILAGGHSLLPALKLRLNQPEKLVNIAGISELKGVKEEDGEIVIGAATTHAEILRDSIIKSKLPFFAQGAATIGDLQVRNCGTIGGSLAHADPASDWTALVLAADAAIEVQGSSGKRRIKSTEFFMGLFSTALQDDEIIIAVRVPIPEDGTKNVYLKFPQPASRFALVGCAVFRSPNGKTNIAFTGVSSTPFRDITAENMVSVKTLDGARIDAAANVAAEDVDILSDHYASEEYRKHLAKAYLKRALKMIA